MSTRGLREAACDYGLKGWAVMPLQPLSKLPHGGLVPHGLSECSSKAGDILYWWEREPTANVAICCEPSGLVVIDVDTRHQGFLTLHNLEERLGTLPKGCEAWTPTGGAHFIFKHPGNVAFKKEAGAGVDIKDRGYIVAAPSLRNVGGSVKAYEWHATGEPPDLPVGWLEHCRQAGAQRQGSGPRQRSAAPLLQVPAAEYIEALTGRYVDSGGWVQCPWHKGGQERTPSMRANDSLWACFVCEPFGGKQMCGGNIIDFAAKLWGYPMPVSGADLAELKDRLEAELCTES